MSTPGKRNKAAGSSWERLCAKHLRALGFHDVRTSRECSRLRDAQKVDLCNADEDANGRLPYNVQCKTLSKAAPYPKLLAELEEHNGRKHVNVVFHKQTEKTEGGRFMPRGEYAICNLDDFYRMISSIERYKAGFKLLNEYFDSIPEEDKEEVHEKLKALQI